jgi:hypothetical protein
MKSADVAYRYIMRHSCWIAVAVASTTASADGLKITLASDTSDAHIVMVDHPADTSGNTVLVAWDHLTGKIDAGAMVFRREHNTDEVRYFAIGGHAPFSIVDRGRHALSAGTSVPVFDVVTDDPAHPATMRVVAGQTIDVPALVARYETFEHVVASGGRTAVDTAIAAQVAKTTKACGHAPAADVAWDPFKKANKLEVASQAVAVYEALEGMCADADYRKAVGKLSKLHVVYRAEGALDLAVAGSTLSATVSPTSFDPREVATKWLHDNL